MSVTLQKCFEQRQNFAGKCLQDELENTFPNDQHAIQKSCDFLSSQRTKIAESQLKLFSDLERYL